MRVNIISYEPAGGWILYDYAEKLAKSLGDYVQEVIISGEQKRDFDVTFHINYWGLRQLIVPGLHCSMVTHIDTAEKFGLVRSQAEAGIWGLCMSEETSRRLHTLTGRDLFVNFAPPAMMVAQKKTLSVMIASRLYDDGRKNEAWAIDFFHRLKSDGLTIRVIGAGWSGRLAALAGKGYLIEYREDFEKSAYVEMLKKSDYLLVTGNDEGALSTLDAMIYGVVPIVTAQGYHLEQEGELILYSTHAQLMAVAERLQNSVERTNRLRASMTDWNSFAEKHFDFWARLISTNTASQSAIPAHGVRI